MKTFNQVSVVISTILGGILGILVLCTIIALPLYFLWNWLIPPIFNLPEITMLQSFGLMLLSNLLFKSFNTNLNKNDIKLENLYKPIDKVKTKETEHRRKWDL